MRVLFVAGHLAGPAVRGDQVRARELLAGLSRRHSVTVIDIVYRVDDTDDSNNDANVDATHDAAQSPPVACARYVPIRIHRAAMAIRAGLALPSRTPLQAAIYDSMLIRSRIARTVRHDMFDLAHVQLARLGGMLPALKPLPVVLDFIDALSSNMRNRAAHDRGAAARIASIDAARMSRYERALCRRIDIGVVCAPRERDAIGNFGNLRVVPMGVTIDAVDGDAGSIAELEYAPDSSLPKLIFTGNLGYFPNVDAAAWFIDEVMPLLRSDVPGVTLELAGARPARRLRDLAAANADVSITADVPDIRSRIREATIAIASVRAGSGQQTKVLEAMAVKKPVVTTSTVAAAIDAIDGEHLLVADTPQEMCDAIVRLLRQWPLRMRLADGGRRLVETRHDWNDQVDAMDALWAEAVESRGTRRRRSR